MAGPKFVIEVVPPRHDGCLPGFRQHLVELLVAAHVTAGLGACATTYAHPASVARRAASAADPACHPTTAPRWVNPSR